LVPDDGEVALLTALAQPIAAALESPGLLAALGFAGIEVLGSGSDVCSLGLDLEGVAPSGSQLGIRRGRELQEIVSRELLHLGEIVTSALSALPSGVLPLSLGSLPECLGASPESTIEIDAADVRAAAVLPNTLAAVGHALAAYDVDFDLDEALAGGRTLRNRATLRDILVQNPNVLTLTADGPIALDRARGAVGFALDDFVATIGLIRAEADDPSEQKQTTHPTTS
jgi:hypothetical protein